MRLLKHPASPWIILVVVALLWRVVYAYWTPILEQYIVPPGDDAVFHITAINNLMQGHLTLFSGTYPLGFHYIIAILATLLGISALQAVIWLTPALLVIPILVIYFVGSRLFKSDAAGAIASASWAFLALGPVRALGDGNYVNLLASSILLPLAVLSIYNAVQAPKLKRYLLAVLMVGLIAITHHLTLVYLLVIIMPSLTLILFEKIWSTRHSRQSWRTVFAIVGIAFAILTLLYVFYRTMLGPYLSNLWQGQSLAQAFGTDNKSLDLIKILEINNAALIVLGLVGLIALMLSRSNRHLKLIMASWVLILIAISTAPYLALQGRFARELAVPCALLVGFLGAAFVRLATRHKATAGAVFIIVLVFSIDLLASFSRPFTLPNPFSALMRVDHTEETAIKKLRTISNPSTIILSANSNPFLPLLVDANIIVPPVAGDLVDILRQPIDIVYIGARPALTEIYPYYQNYDEISQALRAIPKLELVEQFANGSAIYRMK